MLVLSGSLSRWKSQLFLKFSGTMEDELQKDFAWAKQRPSVKAFMHLEWVKRSEQVEQIEDTDDGGPKPGQYEAALSAFERKSLEARSAFQVCMSIPTLAYLTPCNAHAGMLAILAASSRRRRGAGTLESRIFHQFS